MIKKEATIIRGSGGGGKGGSSGSTRAPREDPDSLISLQYARVLDLICEGEIEGLADGLKSVYLDDTPIQNADGTFNFNNVNLYTRNGTQAQTHIPGISGVESEVAVGVLVESPSTEPVSNVGVTILVSTSHERTNLTPTDGRISVKVKVTGDRHEKYIESSDSQYADSPIYEWVETNYLVEPVKFTIEIDEGAGYVLRKTAFVTSMYNNDTRNYHTYEFSVNPASTCSVKITNITPQKPGAISTLVWTSYTSFLSDAYGYVVRSISDPNLDMIRVTLGVPRLTRQDTTTGDLHGSTVAYAIDIQSNGGGYVEIVSDQFKGKTTTKFQRSHDIALVHEGPWDIRVRRVTPDNASSAINDLIYWDSYTKIIDEKFSYPNSALVGIEIDASQFNHIPTRGYECKLLKVKVPSNYDPLTRIYTGIWDGTFTVAWTDNPAWCFYDLVTSTRYGLGGYIDEALVDKWTLYEVSQYCDELVSDGFGGTEPRFTCNLYLQTRAEALSVIRNMASIFRAMLYWSTNLIIPIQDSPSTPYAQFTNANVLDGAFAYQGSASKVRHTVALVSYNDPQSGYKLKVEYVEDQDAIVRYGYNETEIIAFGCTSRGQAHRLGKWLLYSEVNETEAVTFSTGLEGTSIAPGVLIETLDQFRAGKRFGGRVVSSTSTSITIDSPIAIEAGVTYSITVILPDGTLETKSVTNSIGTGYTVLTLDSSLSQQPQTYSVWVVAASNLLPEVWRVVSVAENDNGIYTINAIEHNSSKFNFVEQNLVLEISPTSVIPLSQDPVSVINIEESLYVISTGVFGTKINVDWEAPVNAAKYTIRYRKDEGNYTTIETRDPHIEILNGGFGEYTFIITAHNALGKSSTNATFTSSVLGETAPPEDVINFAVSIINGIAIFTWDPVSDIDVKEYEIREGTVWATGTVVATTNQTLFERAAIISGSHDYMIKAIDYYGIYSAVEDTAILNISNPITNTITYITNEDSVLLSWSGTTTSFPIDVYEIRINGTSWADATPLTITEGNSYTDQVLWSARTYRIKAKDTAGNYSSDQTLIISISNPTLNTFTHTHTSSSIILNWTATQGILDIEQYEIRFDGTDWASATSVGFTSNNSITLPVSWAVRTFRIKAFDYSSNTSNELTLVSTVALPNTAVVSHLFAANVLSVSWTAIAGTLQIAEYEVREGGADWASATFVTNTTGTTYEETVSAGSWSDKVIRIKAIDLGGNYSAVDGTTSVTISAPGTPVVNNTYDYKTIIISWTAAINTLPIAHYEVRYDGSDWATATVLGTYDVNTLHEVVEWPSRTYRVKAVDIAGFYSSEGSKVISITTPAIATMTAQIVDNNALIYWSVTPGTLPSYEIEIRRGAVYASATVIGKKTGTFTVVFEPLGGTYTYWITPIDSAGNYGTPYSKTIIINQPPDYVLRQNWDSDLSTGTPSSMIINANGELVGPTNTTETFAQHFTNNSWSTPQDQITAGYPYYLQPTPTPATYIETFDYGAVLAATKISVALTYVTIAGSVTITPKISVSDDDISYTDYNDVWEVLASNFRYVKITLTVSQASDTGIIAISNLNLRLDVKLVNDSGSGTANSGDTGGTVVNFNNSFVDVDAINVTPLNTTAAIPVVDFTDTPNPTSFKVLIFDKDGARVTSNFSWSARGY